ncbi:PH domain-containing protein [Haloarcula nitratireducens]|uniref:PH domain-containing protein n=1 Tax=Haloarcula nitratireducens TaxID=2487749 RepID=A0AAW4P7B0_9EURY|nr:PH domain-containing protein [Halomicroarcula nitratireducens]MBX0293636.1 PH domain-containing protein [Halomicroarcula nitratireducens]
MSDLGWLSLDGDEEIRWRGQPRQRVVLQGVALGLVAALVAGALGWLALGAAALSTPLVLAAVVPIAFAAFAVPTAAAWLWRRTTRYVLTETALYHRTGVLSVTVTELSLRKVQNTSYAQGVLGNIFDHGTVTVDTAGSEGAELRLVAMDDPATVQRRIAERAQRVRGDDADVADVPGTAEQWRAVLAEVRGVRVALSRE